MMNKEFATKIDNLESQIQELTHFVARILKKENPISSTQEPHALFQANKESLSSNKATPESTNVYSEPPILPVFSTKIHR